MNFINNLVSILTCIIIILSSSSSKKCDLISNFIINNNVIFTNTTESTVFLPTDIEFIKEPWTEFVSSDDTYDNIIRYNGRLLYTLEATELNINDTELTNTIHKSLHDDNQNIIPDLINVYKTSFVTRIGIVKKIFSFDYRYIIKAVIDTTKYTECKNIQIQYTKAKMPGLICSITFIAGLKYNVKCGNVELELLPITSNKKLEFDAKCIT
jgi:hypothetical protein